ncbi:cation-transporting P-type ATPase [Patescibacteria group bacterium]|nr:MAG: cation-transporting P-type ATPase [Patescibacteria group bacterium]
MPTRLDTAQVPAWHALGAAEAAQALGVDAERGLAHAEAERRRGEHGPNALPRPPRHGVGRILYGNLSNPIALVLICAAAVSLAVGHVVDAAVLAVVIVLNIGFAVIQEYKADQAIEKILALLDYRARVLRDGREHEISSADVVPGDLLVLKPGMKVAADARVIVSAELHVGEAALTGESDPVAKTADPVAAETAMADRVDMLYLGTTVDAGTGRALVVATGSRTELGRIVALTRATREPQTPLQEKLTRLARWLTLALLVIGAGVFALLQYRGEPPVTAFVTVVALIASSVPEGLLPAITIILTVAMRRILKAGSLVRRMAAVESLGAASVICIDKTGTITEGKMRARTLLTMDGEHALDGVVPLPPDARDALAAATLGLSVTVDNPADPHEQWRTKGSATETALLLAAARCGMDPLARAARIGAELPFDSSYKFAGVVTGNRMIVRGAPDILLARATHVREEGQDVPLTDARKARLQGTMLAALGAGLRGLALCEMPAPVRAPKADDVRGLTVLGIFLLQDPVRPETKAMLSGAAAAGIRTIMLTGDHRVTAEAVAREIGMPTGKNAVVDGATLERLSDDALRAMLPKLSVVARVTPAQKLRIVQLLQKMGETVAVTGDGVNDAPALNAAEIGIALGSGTDVAKESADIVLLDDNFRTIMRSVEEGRFAFQNLRKATVYMIADDFAEISLIIGALLLGFPLPLTTPQILWINVVESGFLNFGLALEAGEEAVLRDAPRRRGRPFFSPHYQQWLAAIAIIIALVTVPAYLIFLTWTGDLVVTRTMLLVTLSLQSVFMVFVVRKVRTPSLGRGMFTNRWLNMGAVVSSALIGVPIFIPQLQGVFSTTPLAPVQWFAAVLTAAIAVVLIEAAKMVIVVRHHRQAGRGPSTAARDRLDAKAPVR